MKCNLLNVPEQQLKEFTPESETIRSTTTGIQKLIPADILIGCTGLIWGKRTPYKPVGTMFPSWNTRPAQVLDERIVLQGHPQEIVSQTITFLATHLHEYLKSLITK
ncbi:CinA family protein [Pedobacter sp. V48]|uniref:CinA family protein n=1 Tax=Pedobacter sp. V48 TaxID=509635 RepID=UPI0013784C2A